MSLVYLILGGNLGDRLEYLAQAKKELGSTIGVITKQSSLYETEPWGFVHENLFLNQVILIETTVEPMILLTEIKKIETSLGRIKGKERYSARFIDIDILFYDQLILNSSDLVIPHTEIEKRRFVLEPLTEISPSLEHPVLIMTCEKLLALCNDECKVSRIEK